MRRDLATPARRGEFFFIAAGVPPESVGDTGVEIIAVQGLRLT